ncbi:MAG: hypothetical protein IT271_07885 [Chitinophagales bacterium]|nr:hypothetical protein [Chitinophagales bacterium]
MLKISGQKLRVTKDIMVKSPKAQFIGIMHALSDTEEFLQHLLEAEHKIHTFFAKPYSINHEVIERIRQIGIDVQCNNYDILENTSVLEETIKTAHTNPNDKTVLIDVGGYFAKPLEKISKENPDYLPQGVLEVTTFGHNRYQALIDKINTPIVSIARSPLKDVEAVFVGESTWLAIDKVLREVGVSAFGSKVGIVGYGMIGRRVASAARSNGATTRVFDLDTVKLLDARSYKHEVKLSLEEILKTSEIVISSTGGTSISTDAIVQHAPNGLVLASAGSKVQELDVKGLSKVASKKSISEHIYQYTLPDGREINVIKDGAAANFIVGSCPNETMDIVFAEMTEGINDILNSKLKIGTINEISQESRAKIALAWLQNRP